MKKKKKKNEKKKKVVFVRPAFLKFINDDDIFPLEIFKEFKCLCFWFIFF